MSGITVKQETIQQSDLIYDSVRSGQLKLQSFIKAHYPDLKLDSVTIQKKLSELKETKKEIDKTLLNLLDDLNKLNQLQKMNIDGKTYYTLAESAGGVTEKVSLIDEATVLSKLATLNNSELSTDSFNTNEVHKTFKLSTNAILKLPKHGVIDAILKSPNRGKVTEVQHESMALQMSRILGLTTTQSTLVNYNNKPALFVPFDNIRLLSDVATGKTMHAALSSKTYTHYSTLNPVGAGLQANPIIDDLGHSIGLFYLCSDTDAIGGYNQNKALKGNHLFVFDQVFSLDDKLGLDSRLSMQPTKWLTKHTRHDQGRNRMVIEDSSIDTKFKALMDLKGKRGELKDYCSQIINNHQQTLAMLQQEKRQGKDVQADIKLTKTLLRDAKKVLVKLEQRLDKIDTIFPKIKGSLSNSASFLKPTLILEKVLNRPVLFASDGRPYRNPWTQRNPLRATNISEDADPNFVRIRFNKSIPLDVLDLLRKKTGHDDSPTRSWFKTIRILKDDLMKLQENIYFPEHDKDFDPNAKTTHYLDIDDLKLIKKGYQGRCNENVIDLIKYYNSSMLKFTDENKLQCINAVESKLIELKEKSDDKGFIQHILKKYHLDVQQKLQALMPEEQKPKNIDEAFKAALKLDQVSVFNQVVNQAIRHDKLNDRVFTDFLETCISQANNITDHASAIESSQDINKLSATTLIEIKKVNPQLTQTYKQLAEEIRAPNKPEIPIVNSSAKRAS